jgi:hypothetical protein
MGKASEGQFKLNVWILKLDKKLYKNINKFDI